VIVATFEVVRKRTGGSENRTHTSERQAPRASVLMSRQGDHIWRSEANTRGTVAPGSQVARWRRAQSPDSDNADRLAGLSLVVEMLVRWLELDAVGVWLDGPNALWGDVTPSYLIRQGRVSDVIGALEAEKAGAPRLIATTLWLAFPWDSTRRASETHSPSHVPRPRGRGRFDLPLDRRPSSTSPSPPITQWVRLCKRGQARDSFPVRAAPPRIS
jgi:hypothetical protein